MNTNTQPVVQDKTSEALEQSRSLPVITPEVDIFENDNEILLYADMPGVSKEDISINIDNGKMAMAGIRHLDTEGAKTWQEFGAAEFRRNFSVPQTIDTNRVTAELSDGVLRLHLPKSEAAKPRQIEITAP